MVIALTTSNDEYWPQQADRTRIEDAQEAASALATRLRSGRRPLRNCPLRVEFVRRGEVERAPTPMMRLLGGAGGRGGDIRFKLYLSLVWASPAIRDDAYSTDFPASNWAQLLGLPQYSTKGRHRIYESIDWLHEHDFIEKVKRPGQEPQLRILSDVGNGGPYVPPSTEAERGGPPSYRQLNSDWWVQGWMATVTGRALAFWIILLDRVTKEEPTGPLWIAESVTTSTYGFSPYLRQNAMRELVSHGLITSHRNFVKKPFGMQSSRTLLALNLDRLTQQPRFRSRTPA